MDSPIEESIYNISKHLAEQIVDSAADILKAIKDDPLGTGHLTAKLANALGELNARGKQTSIDAP